MSALPLTRSSATSSRIRAFVWGGEGEFGVFGLEVVEPCLKPSEAGAATLG
jgi:hypothetical protein